MKKLLYLILENSHRSLEVLDHLRLEGYNGTLMETASLRHAFDEEFQHDRHFFNLAQWEETQKNESTVTLFVEEETQMEKLKAAIRSSTSAFSKVRGAMFTIPLNDFEGTI